MKLTQYWAVVSVYPNVSSPILRDELPLKMVQ